MSLISDTLTKIIFGNHIYFYVHAPDFHPLWKDPLTRRKLNNVREITRDNTNPLKFRKLVCSECKKIKLDHVIPVCENCSDESNIMISFRPHGTKNFLNQDVQRIPVYKKIKLYHIWSVIYHKEKKPKGIEIIKYFTIE